MAVPAVGPLRFWYAGVRFSGWAATPISWRRLL